MSVEVFVESAASPNQENIKAFLRPQNVFTPPHQSRDRTRGGSGPGQGQIRAGTGPGADQGQIRAGTGRERIRARTGPEEDQARSSRDKIGGSGRDRTRGNQGQDQGDRTGGIRARTGPDQSRDRTRGRSGQEDRADQAGQDQIRRKERRATSGPQQGQSRCSAGASYSHNGSLTRSPNPNLNPYPKPRPVGKVGKSSESRQE
ncbi:hypothetical protein WMY93_025548 [Mugilogobius chulae]|uniref:Uncharacterized protein n=1 Tax=Mugilogobius chulae TaxID=88201 RepID=A0AAW0N7C1_9GOBI